jgi:Xaa-Pro aminopeptidase
MVSLNERRRRYEALRRVMERENCEVLVAAGREGAIGRGFIRYLSDWHLWGGLGFVVIGKDAEPVLILGSESQAMWAAEIRWVKDVRFHNPVGDGLIDCIRDLCVPKRIHVAGLHTCMTYADIQRLKNAFPSTEIVDATPMLEGIMAVKSDEELALLQETADAVCAAMEVFKAELRPGRTEKEVVAKAWEIARSKGILDGIAHISNRFPPFIHPPTNSVIRRDDIIKFSMEMAGPSGYWIELSAIFSFANPPREYMRAFETTKKAVEAIAALLKPGTRADEIPQAVERVFADDGWSEVNRVIWDAHGIGLDVIEYPVLTRDNRAVLEENMVISVHPGLTVGKERLGIYIQDNFIVRPGGAKPQSAWKHGWHVID